MKPSMRTPAALAAIGLSVVMLGCQPTPDAKNGEALVKANDCNACHSVLATDRKRLGPNFGTIAAKYQNASDADITRMAMKIKNGGSGTWGKAFMARHPQSQDADLKSMVLWVLTQK